MDGFIDFLFARSLFLGIRTPIKNKKSDIKILGLVFSSDYVIRIHNGLYTQHTIFLRLVI